MSSGGFGPTPYSTIFNSLNIVSSRCYDFAMKIFSFSRIKNVFFRFRIAEYCLFVLTSFLDVRWYDEPGTGKCISSSFSTLSESVCRQCEANELIGLNEIPYFYLRSGRQCKRIIAPVSYDNGRRHERRYTMFMHIGLLFVLLQC
jgi:hypothetical protein